LEDGSFESEQGATLAQQCQNAAKTAREKVTQVETILGNLTNLDEVLNEIIAIQDDLIDGITIYVLPEVTQETEGHVLVAE
jgi:hypothetical protein